MITNYLWLPILFIIHDFEEIIFVPTWVFSQKETLASHRRPLFGGTEDASILAIGVLEEFLILVGISLYSFYTNSNSLYFYVTIVYTLHLLLHLVFCIQYKNFVPGIFTAILQLPIVSYILYKLYLLINPTIVSLFFYTFVSFSILLLNVLLLHKIMNKFQKRKNPCN